MLNDITLGQYFPGNSPIHRMDPRMKLILTILYIVGVFVVANLPGYAIALVLTHFVSPIFVGIAFDSGGVASGPMTSTFLLPLAIGACTAADGNVVTDAFGVVALVAMVPLIAVQVMGLITTIREKRKIVSAGAAQKLSDDIVVAVEEDSDDGTV